MNILFIVPYVPTLIRTRPYNLVRFLARRGHRITLATLWEDADEREFLRGLAHDEGLQVLAAPLGTGRKVSNLALGLFSSEPIQARYCWSYSFAQRLTRAVQERDFDVIHVEHLRGVRYALHLQSSIANPKSQILNRKSQIRNPKSEIPNPPCSPPIVWDAVDSITHLFEQAAQQSQSLKGRVMTKMELGRTRRYETWLLGQFQRILVTSPKDKAAFERLLPQSPVTVLPNGVDLSYFSPDGSLRKPATIVFSGKMSYHANVTAAVYLVREIMPLVWRRRPDVRVEIVGKDPTREVQALAAGEPRVTVTGLVPDIRPYLRRATLAVSPIRYGAGIQNKVLEAMACGAPVVASSLAVSALAVQPGEDLLVADDPAAFTGHILRIIETPSLQARLSKAGRAYVEAHHDWGVIVTNLEDNYRALGQNRSVSPASSVANDEHV